MGASIREGKEAQASLRLGASAEDYGGFRDEVGAPHGWGTLPLGCMQWMLALWGRTGGGLVAVTVAVTASHLY